MNAKIVILKTIMAHFNAPINSIKHLDGAIHIEWNDEPEIARQYQPKIIKALTLLEIADVVVIYEWPEPINKPARSPEF